MVWVADERVGEGRDEPQMDAEWGSLGHGFARMDTDPGRGSDWDDGERTSRDSEPQMDADER